MAIDMPLVFIFLIYALCVAGGISIIQYDYYLGGGRASGSYPSSINNVDLGVTTANLRDLL